MPELTISIAGISIAIRMEEPLGSLVHPLKKLFRGFLCDNNTPHVIVKLSFDIFNTYPRINALPTALTVESNPEYSELIHKIGEMYPLSKESLLIGYFNGCLAFNHFSNEGEILFFKTKRSNPTIGSLYKLLFVFISLVLADNNRYMLHGAGIKGDTGGYLFLGQSGAGKTTVASFSRKQEILSDDSPIVKKEKGIFSMYASPFSQVNLFKAKSRKHYLNRVQLSKMFFLKKSKEVFLKKRTLANAMAEILMQHIHGFEFMGKEGRTAAFHFCHDLCGSIPSYDLYFQKNGQLWGIIQK